MGFFAQTLFKRIEYLDLKRRKIPHIARYHRELVLLGGCGNHGIF